MRPIIALAFYTVTAGNAPAATRLEIAYETCLKENIIKHRLVEKLAPEEEVTLAAKACSEIAPEFAEDIRVGILECGVEPGDSSPDMECGNEVIARPPVASPDATKALKNN